jgi:hypothetical protein
VDLAYMDGLVLTKIGRLPDHAEIPHDDAASLLLRYALTLVDKRRGYFGSADSTPSFDEVQRELEDWESRVRPLLKSGWRAFRPQAALPTITSLVEVR